MPIVKKKKKKLKRCNITNLGHFVLRLIKYKTFLTFLGTTLMNGFQVEAHSAVSSSQKNEWVSNQSKHGNDNCPACIPLTASQWEIAYCSGFHNSLLFSFSEIFLFKICFHLYQYNRKKKVALLNQNYHYYCWREKKKEIQNMAGCGRVWTLL